MTEKQHRLRALTTLNPGDVIEWTNWKHPEHSHRWLVTGIHLGALGQESVVTLENVSHSPTWDEIHLPVMWVPECLTRQCRIVQSNVKAKP